MHDDVARLPKNFAIAALVETHLQMFSEKAAFEEWLTRKRNHTLKLECMIRILGLIRDRAAPMVKKTIYTYLCGVSLDTVLRYETKVCDFYNRKAAEKRGACVAMLG